MENKIKELCIPFFDKLLVDYDSIGVKSDSERIFTIFIKSNDSGVLIGPGGKTLEMIRGILSSIVSRQIEKRIIIHVEINDYLKNKDEKLYSFIKSKVNFVMETGKEVALKNFSSYDRKKIHGYVNKIGEGKIETISRGEGKERKLFITKKVEKLTIDIDGIDI